MSDEEDYGFEYSDEEEEEKNIEIENEYYIAKGRLETDQMTALEKFHNVVAMEEIKGDWGFKSLKHIVKILFNIGHHEEMIQAYRELLTYSSSAVTQNVSEKVINKILDYVSSFDQHQMLHELYRVTLEALEQNQNERLWFRTQIKLAYLYFNTEDLTKLSKILRELRKYCQNPDGSDDHTKGGQLLEVYALLIQMYTIEKQYKELKELYEKSLRIKSAIPHPRIVGIIRECGAKMHMRHKNWEQARIDFFESFKAYDESGSPRRLQCLKYLVLSNLLMESNISPFDSPETKPYERHPEIIAMTNLVDAYLQQDIKRIERILQQSRDFIMDDDFTRSCIEELLLTIRSQVILKMVKPYKSVRITHLSQEMSISESDVEKLLVSLILDKKIDASIDQINKIVYIQSSKRTSHAYEAINRWADNLELKQKMVIARASQHFY